MTSPPLSLVREDKLVTVLCHTGRFEGNSEGNVVNDHMKKKKSNDPDDEVLIKEVDAWEISFSKTKDCIFIDTTSYHPFKLKLTKNELLEFVKIIDGSGKR